MGSRGHCDPKFRGVLEAFAENFDKRGEVGASCAIALEGKTVVDVWGGRKAVDGDAWQSDTISIVFSSTKGASALCAHIAADRGQLDLDAPVTKYWPAFGQAGKEEALVSMMLDHSVGLPAIREKLKDGATYDYDYMVGMLERETPLLEARHAQWLSRHDQRLDGGRDGPPLDGRAHGQVPARRGVRAAGDRLLDGPAGGARAPASPA